MVFLAPRFILLTAFCSLALPAVLPSVDARAVASRHQQPAAESTPASGSKTKHAPLLSLPTAVGKGASGRSADKHRKPASLKVVPSPSRHGHDRKSKGKKAGKRRLARSVAEGGDSLSAREPHSDRHHHHHDKRTPSRIMRRHHHHHDGDDKVIVEGDDAHVHVHRSPEPRHHHHHHHDHKRSTSETTWDPLLELGLEVGDVRDGSGPEHHHVFTHSPRRHVGRSPHEIVIVDGHRHGHDLIIDYAHRHGGDRVIHVKRDDSSTAPGVPGTVDIVIANSGPAQKVASLVLSATASNTTNATAANVTAPSQLAANSFVLDASNSTQTQVYLVVSPASNATTNDSGTSANGTTGSQTSFPLDIQVTLQLPVFEPSEAAMKQYCATFDPNPPAAAPLTMERCTEESQEDDFAAHKSQKFAYNPQTGVIRPVWIVAAVNDSDSEPAQLFGIKDSAVPSSNTTDSASVTGPTDSSQATGASVSSPSASSSAAPSAPTATDSDAPQNVMLVFTPIVPVVHAAENPSTAASSEPADDPSGDEDETSTTVSADATASSLSASDDSAAAATATASGPASTETAAPSSCTESAAITATASASDKNAAASTASASSVWMLKQERRRV